MDHTCACLDLQDCYLYPADAYHLAEMLKVNTTLTQLWLNNNQIGDAGFCSICAALKESRNKTVKLLDLTSNGVEGTYADTIEEMITTNQTLTHLYLWKNSISEETRTQLKSTAAERTPRLCLY